MVGNHHLRAQCVKPFGEIPLQIIFKVHPFGTGLNRVRQDYQPFGFGTDKEPAVTYRPVGDQNRTALFTTKDGQLLPHAHHINQLQGSDPGIVLFRFPASEWLPDGKGDRQDGC